MADDKEMQLPLLQNPQQQNDEGSKSELPDAKMARSPAPDVLAPPPGDERLMGRSNSLLRMRNSIGEQLPPPPVDQSIESLDTEDCENVLMQKWLQDRSQSYLYRTEIARWALSGMIGVGGALCAFFVILTSAVIVKTKMDIVKDMVATNQIGNAFAVFASINFLLVFITCLMCIFIAPLAAKSGIIEVRALLNGVKINKAVRAVTLAVKTVGLALATSSNVCVGREGPMIHIGAMIGAGVSQGKSSSMGFDTSWSKFKAFRNDKEKRDFIATGAAAGVATAFGAPIGGAIFSQERASFWNNMLTFRTLFCALTSTFVLNIFVRYVAPMVSWIHLTQPGMFSYLPFTSQQSTPYEYYEVPFFILTGIMGGLIGAAFNSISMKFSAIRHHVTKTVFRQILDGALMSLLTSGMLFFISYYFPMCREFTGPSSEGGANQDVLQERSLRFTCQENSYSDMATLLLSPSEDVIAHLLHSDVASIPIVLAFFFIYTFLCLISYGIMVPAGLFIPCLLSGSAFGRVMGETFLLIWPNAHINPGTYALLGSAAMLGGVMRMTMSATVILIEATGGVQFGLPIMITIICSKVVGDYFNDGIYDLQSAAKGYPYLESDPDLVAHYLDVDEVCSSSVYVVHEVEHVGSLVKMLRSNNHNGFPVIPGVGGDRSGGYVVRASDQVPFRGLISRHIIAIVLSHPEVFVEGPPRPGQSPSVLTWEDIQNHYPRFPPIHQVPLTYMQRQMYVDLTPFIDKAPHTVTTTTHGQRAFRLFRTMGLRHLPVVDQKNNVAGIITRKDMLTSTLQEKADAVLENEQMARSSTRVTLNGADLNLNVHSP